VTPAIVRLPNVWRIGSLTMAGVTMGVCLLAFCIGILAIGKFGMNLGIGALRTLAFAVLVFGSQATLYAIRERRHLWGTRPSLWLALSSVADIVIASTLAVGGIAMTSLPPLTVAGTLAAAVVFAFVLDLVKVPVFARLGIAERPHDRSSTHAGMAKTEAIPMTEPGAAQPKASDSKPDAKAKPEPDAKAEPKPEAKAPTDLTPQIAKRSYELYEERGRQDGRAVQDWEKAEREIRKAEAKADAKPEANTEPKPEGKAEPKPDAKAEPKPEANPEPKPDAKAEPKPEANPESKPEAKAESKPEAKAEPKPEAKAEPKPENRTEPKPDDKARAPSDLTPQLVKRVHQLYEDLGRKDVQAVEELEKAEREQRKDEPDQ